MKRLAVAMIVFGLVAGRSVVAGPAPAPAGPYDPTLNGWKQVEAAGAAASAQGKRVLVVVGGNWCPWCRALDRLMTEDATLRGEVAAHYELVHLNYSKENKNPDAMARLGNPNTLGFPSFVVLSPRFKVLRLQESGVFETGDKTKPGHDPAKLLAFLKQWEK
jgi:thiol-disulfide isomerase/thioredoxin